VGKETVRTHVIMPRELVETIDKLVGRRSRSKFVTEAAEREIRRIKLIRAAEKAGGSLANVDIPGWETSESASAWVRASRQADQEHADRGLKNR
jgi:metal-responsive CopG/Arc/MetJ family transcriptional regulator